VSGSNIKILKNAMHSRNRFIGHCMSTVATLFLQKSTRFNDKKH